MKETKRHREELVEQIIELTRASLALRGEQELASVLHALTATSNVLLSQAQAFSSPDKTVLLLLNPTTSKEEALVALDELADELEDRWEEIADGFDQSMSRLTAGAGADKQEKLPN